MIFLIVIMSISMVIAGHLDNSPEAREAWSQNKQLSLRLFWLSPWLSPGPTFCFWSLCNPQASLHSSTDMGQYPDLLDIPNRDSTVSPRFGDDELFCYWWWKWQWSWQIPSSTCPTSSIPPPLPPDPRSSTPPQVHLHPYHLHHHRQHYHRHHHHRQHHCQHHCHHPHHHDGFKLTSPPW